MLSVPKTFTPVLAVDDDEALLLSIKASLIAAGMPEPATVSDSRQVMDIIESQSFRVVLLDLIMPHVGGIELLKKIKKQNPHIECIITTAVDDAETAVAAMKFGAYDYLVKPLLQEKLLITIKNALEKFDLRQNLNLYERHPTFSELKQPDAFESIVASDEAMALVFHQAETYGHNDYHLMITGETGVGKEVLAHAIHRLSMRSEGPFIAVSMPSLSSSLFEDEVFGHAKGAYTGANTERKGFFEEADGGTLFLDEIADMSPELQAKLLRVIQEKELYRLGSTNAREIDVRIISASNKNIHEEVEEGNFRRDLLHRLKVCHINIPPLRKRKKDILPLSYHFLKIHCEKTGKEIDSISPEASRLLENYSFPGNVRELQNIIASAVLAQNGDTLNPDSLGFLNQSCDPETNSSTELIPLSELERIHIKRVLSHTGENRTKAASILGISVRTLQRKLKQYG